MTDRLENKVALVTGASSGIGLAIAKRFAREGAKVALADINEEVGRESADELGEAAIFIKLNVAEEAQWESAFAAVIRKFGRVDVVVNNAGIADGMPIEDLDLDVWNKVVAINGTGTFLGVKHGIRSLRKFGGGSIINMSSIEGFIGEPQLPAYNFTKGGVRMLTKSAALYCLCASRSSTSLSTPHTRLHPRTHGGQEPGLREVREEPYSDGTPRPAGGHRNMALFLVFDESTFTTGSEFKVDGDYTAQ